MQRQEFLADETATVDLGQRLGAALLGGAIVYLDGTLGAGKTTLSRGMLSAFGHSGAVKSPTYTLVEPYEFADVCVYHFDLYRLADAEELEYMGIRDYFSKQSIAIIEWPSRGMGAIPTADIEITMAVSGQGRTATISAQSDLGQQVLQRLGATEE